MTPELHPEDAGHLETRPPTVNILEKEWMFQPPIGSGNESALFSDNSICFVTLLTIRHHSMRRGQSRNGLALTRLSTR